VAILSTVRTLRSSVLLPLAALALFGCRDKVERTLRDSEGREARASCDDSGECRLLGEDGAERRDLFVRRRSRAIGLCSGEADFECRALVCTADAECPSLGSRSEGSCVNGLCIEPANEIGRDDAVMLCLFGTGPGKSSPVQVDRYALAVNCGSPCQVPRVCRQF
jgi:hypothetical protein